MALAATFSGWETLFSTFENARYSSEFDFGSIQKAHVEYCEKYGN